MLSLVLSAAACGRPPQRVHCTCELTCYDDVLDLVHGRPSKVVALDLADVCAEDGDAMPFRWEASVCARRLGWDGCIIPRPHLDCWTDSADRWSCL